MGLLLIPLMVVVGRAPDLFYYRRGWDEAAMMAQAWAMCKGGVLYEDILQIRPILNIAIFVPFFVPLPVDVAPHAVKLFNLILVIVAALVVRAIARAWLGDPWSALTAALIFAFHFTDAFEWVQISDGELNAVVPMLVSRWILYFSSLGRRRHFLAGALWGDRVSVQASGTSRCRGPIRVLTRPTSSFGRIDSQRRCGRPCGWGSVSHRWRSGRGGSFWRNRRGRP